MSGSIINKAFGVRSGDPADFWNKAAQFADHEHGNLLDLIDGPNGQLIITYRKNDRTCWSRVRDFAHCPKKSIVETRLRVTDRIRERLDELRQETGYVLPRKAHSKLFGSRKYRDVTVGDMQDLVRTIKDNVKLQPDGVGAAAFSRDQWSRIVEATRVIVKESIAGAQEPSAMEKVRTHLRGHLPGWMANRLIAVLNKLASCSSFFKNPGLHAAVLLVSVFGIGASAGVGIAVVTAVTSLGLYAAFHVYQAARQTPEMQEANFVQNLAKAWGNEFNEGRIHQPGDCNWNLMLLSNGERFISDILSSVYNHGQRTNRDELRSYFRLAFRQAADDCRPVKLIHRESRVADLKLELGRTKYREGKKYVEDAGHRTVDGVLWRTFSRETNKDRKIVVREFIALSNDPIELRLQNNRVWDRISFLQETKARGEEAKLETKLNQSLTGYIGAVKLPNGSVAEIYRDDSRLLKLSDVHRWVDWLGANPKVKHFKYAAEIRDLLVREEAQLRNNLVQTIGIPEELLTHDAFRVGKQGQVLFNLSLVEEWASNTDSKRQLSGLNSKRSSMFSDGSFASTSRATFDSGYTGSVLTSSSTTSSSSATTAVTPTDVDAKMEEKLRKKLADLLNTRPKGDVPEATLTSASSEAATAVAEKTGKKRMSFFGKSNRADDKPGQVKADKGSRAVDRTGYFNPTEEAAWFIQTGGKLNKPV